MFGGKELRAAKNSAFDKHCLYEEMREMYVELAETYVKIRMAVDALAAQYTGSALMQEFVKLYLNSKKIKEPYSMPMLLGDGYFLTLQDEWTDMVRKTNCDITIGYYLNSSPAYLINFEDDHFDTSHRHEYFPPDVIQGQLEWNSVLSEYHVPVRELEYKIRDLNVLQFQKKKRLEAQLQEAQRLYDEKKQEASGWFENGLSPEEVAEKIFSCHGTRRRKFAEDAPYEIRHMDVDAFPYQRPKGLSEEEETQYWKSYEAQLDTEIQKIRQHIPCDDDAYIAYEAFVNGISKAEVRDQLHNDVALYNFWLSASCRVYFKNLVAKCEIKRDRQAERKKNTATLLANLTSFGEYHIKDDVVTGSQTSVDIVAGTMSMKYRGIEKRRQKAFHSDVEALNKKWERFGLE